MLGPRRLARQLRPACVSIVVLVITALYALLAFAVLAPDAMYSVDAGVKLVQARSFVASHLTSLVLSYPGQYLDSTYEFFPFEAPFVFRSRGEWQAIFPAGVALLNAAFAWAGAAGLTVPSLLGAGAALAATGKLAGGCARGAAAMFLLGAATCFWFYAVVPWEHLPALAASTAAFLVARDRRDSRGAWLAGGLLGVATIWRDESLLLLPGLLAVRALRPPPAAAADGAPAWWRDPLHLSFATAIPILAIACLDAWLFDRPIAAHLRHAAGGIASLPGVGAAPGLPLLTPIVPAERLSTLTDYWLLGWPVQSAAGALAIAWLTLVWALRTRPAGTMVLALGLAAASAASIVDLSELLAAPKFVGGLVRLSPFLILAAVPGARQSPGDPGSLRSVLGVTALGYAAGLLLTMNTNGGKGLGPRLLLPLLPLLVVAAVETLAGYRRAAAQRPAGRAAWYLGCLLVAASVLMQVGVAVPAYVAFNRAEAAVVEWIRERPERVLVIDSTFSISLAAPFYDTRVVLLATERGANALSERLSGAGVRSFLLLSRTPTPLVTFPGWRVADEQRTERGKLLQRWVR